MGKRNYKEFYDAMMRVVQDWEDLAEDWSGSNEGYALHTVVKAIATVSEVYVPNGPIAHLARKDEA